MRQWVGNNEPEGEIAKVFRRCERSTIEERA
jgi:hypothetical protein